jgi:hypothetical protein
MITVATTPYLVAEWRHNSGIFSWAESIDPLGHQTQIWAESMSKKLDLRLLTNTRIC